MSGPIVRTGTNPKFWTNWDKVFGDKTEKAGNKKATKDGKSSAKAAPVKATAKKTARKKNS